MQEPRVHPEFYLNEFAPVSALSFLSNSLIISGNAEGGLNFWNLKSRKKTRTFHLKDPILWIGTEKDLIVAQRRFSKDLTFFIKGEDSDWEVAQLTEIVRQLSDCHNGFCKGDVEYGFIACPRGDSGFAVFDQTRMINEVNTEGEGTITSLKLASKSKVLTGYESGNILVTNIFDAKSENLLKVEGGAFPLTLDIFENMGFVGTSESTVETFSESGEKLKHREIPTKGINSARIRRDGKIVAAGAWDSTIKLFSWPRLKPLGALKFHSESVNFICMFDLLAAGSKDGKISFWRVYND